MLIIFECAVGMATDFSGPLLRLLKEAGWEVAGGTKHHKLRRMGCETSLTVPRHGIGNRHLANKLLKLAGVHTHL